MVDVGQRILSAANQVTASNSPQNCISFCTQQGFSMAGIEYGGLLVLMMPCCAYLHTSGPQAKNAGAGMDTTPQRARHRLPRRATALSSALETRPRRAVGAVAYKCLRTQELLPRRRARRRQHQQPCRRQRRPQPSANADLHGHMSKLCIMASRCELRLTSFRNTQNPAIFKSKQVTWLYVCFLDLGLIFKCLILQQNWGRLNQGNNNDFPFYAMQWSSLDASKLAADVATSKPTYILGYNEPDNGGEAINPSEIVQCSPFI